MPVRPAKGDVAWFTGAQDAATATLDLPLVLTRESVIRFALFVDTEATDPLVMEWSADAGATWQPLRVRIHDRDRTFVLDDGTWAESGTRRWVQADATLPGGSVVVRWRHRTDALYLGRGVFVDDVSVSGGLVFNGDRDPDAFRSDGWVLTSN